MALCNVSRVEYSFPDGGSRQRSAAAPLSILCTLHLEFQAHGAWVQSRQDGSRRVAWTWCVAFSCVRACVCVYVCACLLDVLLRSCGWRGGI
jgi:hypothetical protein